jgi:hypothetical protein
MKYSSADKVEEIVWACRLADLPRGENRAILDRLYDGFPPFSEEEASENNVEVNRNDLSGVNALSQARRQWLNAFTKPGNFFSVTLDSGPPHKRTEWGHTITREINRRLKRRRNMMEQLRAKGAMAILHGVGAVNWKDRRTPIPQPVPMSSLMIPSGTDIDFENLEHYAVYDEWTPSQLYQMVYGPKRDPGWNVEMADAQLKYAAEQTATANNVNTYQYMPERVLEAVKGDMGFWGSDAVYKIPVWQFMFRESDDGKGWYRKVILDWESGEGITLDSKARPTSRNKVNGESTFLYSSGTRKYANSLSEILHCQFADCSAVAPFKYHSVRSLGWMLWGVCDLQNRLHCKFNEAVFQSLMWFFRVSSNEQLLRLKMANFAHMGVIPQGIDFVKAQDRFIPDPGMVTMAFARNRQLISENAASFTQDFDKGANEKEMTATETMARVNNVNALVSGMLSLAYTYEEFAYREICRRFCIRGNPDRDVREFRLACLKQDVPPEMLDAERWDVTAERVLGGGNKTLEMAQVQFLQGMRKNLNPDAQRRVDHIAIESSTDDPALAEELASLSSQKKVSTSTMNAQYATERILKGLPFTPPADAVLEDYIMVWLMDLTALIKQMQHPMMGITPEKLAGAFALAQAVQPLIKNLAQDKEEKEKANQYEHALKQLEQGLQALAQKLQKQMKASQQGNGAGNGEAQAAAAKVQAEQAKTAASLKGQLMIDQAKAKNMIEAHGSRTAQKQISFELEQQRKDRAAAAELRRKHIDHMHETALSGIRALQENEQSDERQN